VVQLFVHQGFVIVLAGVMFGGGLAFATTRLLGAWLFGVGSGDPLSFGGSAVILMVVTLLASYLPTRRAMRVDLIVALRRIVAPVSGCDGMNKPSAVVSSAYRKLGTESNMPTVRPRL